MANINENFKKFPGEYMFTTMGKKVRKFEADHPDEKVLRLGIGDVTLPIAPAVIEALHSAVDEMGKAETFHGYAPDLGYAFLRDLIAEEDYKSRGCEVYADEIFISDGAKSDCGDIQEIFASDSKIAVCDPVYPVYVESNVMTGRTGVFDTAAGKYEDVIYMPCTQDTGFTPELPDQKPDIIYLCYPNNPTGSVMTKAQLQDWVDYAIRTGSIIIYDAAYEAYIRDPQIPHSIYECEGARDCAIEIRSFSKKAGFTGLRLGFTVIPKHLKAGGDELWPLWARRHGTRFNGAPYIVQRAGAATYTPEARAQIMQQVDYYMENAACIYNGLKDAGYEVSGGLNAPYIWLKAPNGLSSWEFFDLLLEQAHVVSTPGSGFGPHGEHYMRLSAFGSRENTREAVERIAEINI